MDIMEQYTVELRRRHYAPRTVQAYTSSLRAFIAWLGQEPRRQLPAEVISSYLRACVAQGRSRSYLDQTVSALRVLYLGVFGTPASQFDCPRPPRARRVASAVPSSSEIWQIADCIPSRSHRLAVLMMYGSGLRLKEVVALRVGDVDLAERTVHVIGPVEDSERLTVLHEALVSRLGAHLRHRDRDRPLLVGTGNRPLSPRAIRRAYQKAIRQNNSPVYGSCTVLRSAFVSHQLAAGVPVEQVFAMVGSSAP